MKTTVIKRSIVVAGHKTSVSLEDAFWNALKEIAASRNMTLSSLVARIDAERTHGNLSSAIRLFVLHCYCQGAIRAAPRENASETDDAPAVVCLAATV